MSIRLRCYHPNDLEPVVQLWYWSWHSAFPDLQHPQTFQQWKERLQDEIVPNEQVWIAEISEQLVGFIALRENGGHLDQIFVSPEMQRQGVGTALLKKAQELLPAGITLDTLQRNSQARRFYEKHGFQPGRTGTNSINGHANITYHWTP